MDTTKFLAPLFLFVASATAQTTADLSSWREVGAVKDPAVRAAARRECALMRREAMTPAANGTWLVTNDPFTHLRGASDPSSQFCTSIPFFCQVRPASPFPGRTGFLVGPDLVLTACHGIPNNLAFVQASFQFVFDWSYQQTPNGLTAPSLILPADTVYTAAAIVAHGPSLVGGGPESPSFDFLLIRLDRPVAGNRGFMRLRRSSEPPLALGDSIVTIGHPDGLATKVATAGYVSFLTASTATNPWGTITLSKSPALPGNSGSMYYNPARDLVESVATFGGGLGLLSFGGCLNLGYSCASCEPLQSSGTQIQMFSSFVPALELLVYPLASSSHSTPAGVAYAKASTHFVDLGSVANGQTNVEVLDLSTPASPATTPQLTAQFHAPDASGRTHLNPGERGRIEVLASVAPTVPAGTYVRRFAVADGRWGFRDVIEHRFVVTSPDKK